MLTILIKRANGSECLSEAHSVELSNLGDTSGSKTFYVFSGPNDQVPDTIRLDQPGDALFVMNRHGGTVAKYYCDHLPISKPLVNNGMPVGTPGLQNA